MMRCCCLGGGSPAADERAERSGLEVAVARVVAGDPAHRARVHLRHRPSRCRQRAVARTDGTPRDRSASAGSRRRAPRPSRSVVSRRRDVDQRALGRDRRDAVPHREISCRTVLQTDGRRTPSSRHVRDASSTRPRAARVGRSPSAPRDVPRSRATPRLAHRTRARSRGGPGATTAARPRSRTPTGRIYDPHAIAQKDSDLPVGQAGRRAPAPGDEARTALE